MGATRAQRDRGAALYGLDQAARFPYSPWPLRQAILSALYFPED